MPKYNNSTTPILKQGSELLINAMHNACIESIYSYAKDSDSRSGLTLAYAIKLHPWFNTTIDVYWQTAGPNNYAHLPTVLRDVQREHKEHGKSLPQVITPNGGVYSRTEGTLRAPGMYGHAGSTALPLHTRTVRCNVDTHEYVALNDGGYCKLLHLGDKPRPIGKVTTEEGLGVILSAMWGIDSGFAGSAYHKLGYLTHHDATALIVTNLVDNKGAAWVVAKHRENWAASRLTARSRATVVQIYT